MNSNASMQDDPVPFDLSVYVEAEGLARLENDADEAGRFFDLMTRLGVAKVYLETYRGLEGESRQHRGLAEPEVARRWRDAARQQGLRTAGGMCTGTWAEGLGDHGICYTGAPLTLNCYTSPATAAFYGELYGQAGEVFDEVLIDDWLFNDCCCDRCLAAFADRTGRHINRLELQAALVGAEPELLDDWGRFAADTVAEFTAGTNAAYKRQCPQGVIRWKLPEWIGRYHLRGIRPELHRDLWDGFLVGSEAREGVEPYAGADAYHYLQAVFGEKAQGVWFDILSGLDWNHPTAEWRFVRQLKMSVLSSAPEVVIWGYPEIARPGRSGHIDRTVESLEQLRELSLHCHGVHGLATTRQWAACPADSPEAYLFNHLGTIGVPIVQRAELLARDRAQLITSHSEVDGLRQWIETGGRALVTSGGIRRLVAAGMADVMGLETKTPIAEELAFATFVEAEDGSLHANCRGHEMPSLPFGPVVNPQEARVVAWGRQAKRRIPLAMRHEYGKGEVLTLCLTDAPHCLTRVYAEKLRQLLRDLRS